MGRIVRPFGLRANRSGEDDATESAGTAGAISPGGATGSGGVGSRGVVGGGGAAGVTGCGGTIGTGGAGGRLACPSLPASPAPASSIIQFNDNGGWCWYQDERAVVDPSSTTTNAKNITPLTQVFKTGSTIHGVRLNHACGRGEATPRPRSTTSAWWG